jgi:magnesium-transporting ATPase (P-type)
MSNESEPVIDTVFRNGTLTVIGIILSFSLTFLSQWAQNPVPWTLRELPTMALLGAGIITQGSSLVIFMRHDSLQRRVYDKASKRFLYGLAMTTSGIFLAIFLDLVDLIL